MKPVCWESCTVLIIMVINYTKGMFSHRNCKHIHPKLHEVIHGVHLEPEHIMKKRSIDQPLRILLYYDDSVYRLEQEKFLLINNTVLPEAVHFWERALMVRRTESVIRLNRKCEFNQVFYRKGDMHSYCKNACEKKTLCGEVEVPETHLDTNLIRTRRRVADFELFSHGFGTQAAGGGFLRLPRRHTTHGMNHWMYHSPQFYNKLPFALRVTNKDFPGQLKVCRTCNSSGLSCSEQGNPGTGIEGADFVFYVSAMATERCSKGQTVAYAAHCQQESALDRPIAGHANFCPNSINTKPQELETLLSTVKHEILHALGFSISLFAFYRDSEGNPLTPREENGKPAQNHMIQVRQWSDRVIKTVVRENWDIHGGSISRKIQVMVTPRVVKEVQDHFNCSTLEGAELEDQGEEGTVLTHWEKRVFENEAMTGTHTQNPVYSRLTLALMEDTGWYSANYSMAQPLVWGKSLGCDFVLKSCKNWIDTKREKGHSIHPFCDKVKRDPLETECTDDRSSVALCNLIQYSYKLPSNYQNFDDIPHVLNGNEGFYGGVVSLADYCPYIQEFTWKAGNIIIRGSHCQYAENNPHPDKNFALEEYGEDSRCFDHTDRMWEERTCKQVRQWLHWGSGCYRYKCSSGRLHIMVSNYTYTCYAPEQILRIRIFANDWLHRGALVCPSCEEMCKDQFEESNESCEPPLTKVPSGISYNSDQLTCKGVSIFSSRLIIFIFIIYFFV